mgnify:CR=1 FL=1
MHRDPRRHPRHDERAEVVVAAACQVETAQDQKQVHAEDEPGHQQPERQPRQRHRDVRRLTAGGQVVGRGSTPTRPAGTSTTALYFDNVPVPVENVLGEVGRGHVIALNVLNIGRLELGPNMLAGARQVLHASLGYAAQRVAFGHPISTFGAIQDKLADCVVRMFASESVTWRVVGLIEADTLRRLPLAANRQQAELAAFEEFAAECSLVKILSSEMLDAVADHGVQIHGGFGYHRDYLVERAYRDAGGHTNFENPADPYMTVLGYFNGLRELGGARRILEEEVQNTIKSVSYTHLTLPTSDLG